jgi:acyl carrier protein
MSSRDLEPRIRKAVAEIARRDVSDIGLDDDLVEKLGLDSLQGLQVLAAVEKRFSVRFADERLSALRTLRQIVDAVASAGEDSPVEREP